MYYNARKLRPFADNKVHFIQQLGRNQGILDISSVCVIIIFIFSVFHVSMFLYCTLLQVWECEFLPCISLIVVLGAHNHNVTFYW